jgi:hypothetical protein
MSQTKILLFCTAMFIATHTATAQTKPADQGPVHASLERGDTLDDSEAPYRPVTLTVQYNSPAVSTNEKPDVIRCITVRSASGGPTMRFNVTIPPDAPAGKIDMLLPALSVEDSYKMRFLAGDEADSAVIAEHDLSLQWPVESVTDQAFLDPETHNKGQFLRPVWSNRTRQMVFAISAVACVLLGGSLMIRSAARRLSAATATAIIAGVGLWIAMSCEPLVIRKELGADGGLLLVSCLRDVEYEIPAPYTVPIYHNSDEMSDDDAVIHAGEKLIVRLKSSEPRLFGRPGPVTQPTTIKSDI